MSHYLNDSIFWIEVEKIEPNPYQPRRDFDQNALNDLADSIRQYGVLQPLVVTRKEVQKEDGGIRVSYELIAGERRLRASKIAGIAQVPAVIRAEPEDPKAKLEIAIIENLQREDLNPIDRARAFDRLVKEFGFKHAEVAKKVGRSREYVSNTLRLLDLPEEILSAVRAGHMTEGHARAVMMLADRPDEQKVLFKEILYKKLSVRETEAIAREIAQDRVRKKKYTPDPELVAIEGKLSNTLGTRVHIERRENGGKLVIDFFTNDDLNEILALMNSNKVNGPNALLDRFIATQSVRSETSENRDEGMVETASPDPDLSRGNEESVTPDSATESPQDPFSQAPRGYTNDEESNKEQNLHTRSQRNDEEMEPKRFEPQDQKDEDDDIYSVKHFTI